MKILVLADIESKYLWDFFEKSKLEGIDLILSAGDLSADYLEFLATYAICPVLYVHGNHDTKYEKKPPLGCICIDDDIYEYNGIKILGLGGSMCYNYGLFQYTDKEMKKRYTRLRPKIWRKKGVDILLTHAPALGVNDGEDLPHRGFEIFRTIMDKYEPKLFVHGHVHLNYGREHKREDTYKNTKVINAFEKYIVEI
ncbi:Predicted phosphoesterase [Lachnospiraceae bacterium]|nr:Predicted phosphoesterase [Lachnospiraceae bacterium]